MRVGALLLAAAPAVGAAGLSISAQRPAASTWKRTQCGGPSGAHPAIPPGPYQEGLDYPYNDGAPCGSPGCVLAKDAVFADCLAKCKAEPSCVLAIFAPANCSGQAGPICWTKNGVGSPYKPPGAHPAIPPGPYQEGLDYPYNDGPPCGSPGCVLAKDAVFADCLAKCKAEPSCVLAIFAPANCSGQAGPICWTKNGVGSSYKPPGGCRDSQIIGGPASDGCRDSQIIGGPASSGADLPSQWALDVSADKQPWTAYPRPQMVRGSGASPGALRDTGDAATWANLNGLWEWEKAAEGDAPPFGKTLTGSILVPFPVEACLSGVAPTKSADIVTYMWYRLVFDAPTAGPRTLLHFGAVDWQTSVFLNGQPVGNHTGGFDGFSFEVTKGLKASGNELLVGVHDPSDGGKQPNGKQRISAIDSPGGDTYTPNSGIWQTVWLEAVPATYISALKIDQASTSAAAVTVTTSAPSVAVQFDVTLNGKAVATASGTSGAATALQITSPQLWTPDSPTLYDVKISAGGDTVMSYFGLRTFALGDGPAIPPGPVQVGVDYPYNDGPPCGKAGCVLAKDATFADCEAKCKAQPGCMISIFAPANCSGQAGPICWTKNGIGKSWKPPGGCRESQIIGGPGGKRLLLNGAPIFAAGFLDQSYWPDGIYAAPSDAALESDITATKMFGLNMIRLHQKVNPERWYYHADRHGLLIFQDAPQKYGGADATTVPLFVGDITAMVKGRGNHPCIVQWTTFNEGDCWGVFKTPPYDVAGIVNMVKQLDPTRLIDTDSGGGANNQHIADVNDLHAYPYPADVWPSKTQYAMIGEFGGMGAFVAGKEWVPHKCHSYLPEATPADHAKEYLGMAKTLLGRVDHLSASVYTQTTDLELECDGFLNYDRTNKFSDADTKAIHDANQAIIKAKAAERLNGA